MKASTPPLLTCAVLAFLLFLAASAARADVQLTCWPPRPECSDGMNNDGAQDNRVDYPADDQCVSPDDDSESDPDFHVFRCRHIASRVDRTQFLRKPRTEFENYWIELIDLDILRDTAWLQSLELVPKIWEASVTRTLATPVPGIKDDPGISNLRLQYVGQHEIIGPAEAGRITLPEPFAFPDGLRYVAHALDIQTGQAVTNAGALSTSPTARAGRDGVFEMKLSYSRLNSGATRGSLEGIDVEICPPWPPWPRWPRRRRPWPWPDPPRFDLRISSYKVDEIGLSRVTPLELGLLFPFSNTSRVTPYVGAGLGYYFMEGDSAAARDELGGYGALGMDIHVGDRWGLSLEGAYREVGGDLDLGGPVFKAGLGFSF